VESRVNPFGYPDPVWQLFRETPRAGAWDTPALTATATTPANRSQLRLQVKMAGSRIDDARFQAYGCPTSVAVGAWLAGQVVGREVRELSGIDAKMIQEALEIPEDRAHCALLGEDLVRALVKETAKR
jgi:NifU-like protein involved in Fe-S cluster formation